MSTFPSNESDVPPPDNIHNRVQGPAIGLIVTAGIGIALQAIGFIITLVSDSIFGMYWWMEEAGNIEEISWSGMSSAWSLGGIIIGIALGIIVLFGAIKMKNLESYSFAMAAAIIAIIPCVSPFCLLGLPMGIWALVVITKPEVKSAFRG